MSITGVPPSEDAYAERWRQWQLENVKSSRSAAIQARVVFTLIFSTLAALLGLQLLSPPFWA